MSGDAQIYIYIHGDALNKSQLCVCMCVWMYIDSAWFSLNNLKAYKVTYQSYTSLSNQQRLRECKVCKVSMYPFEFYTM